MADQPDTSTRASESKPLDLDAAREEARGERFHALYSHWLRARAINEDPNTDPTAAHLDAEADLARELCAMPAPLARDVLIKLDVLRCYLDPTHVDHRETTILGAIEADLLRILL